MHKNSKIKQCQNARCDKEYFESHGNLKYCSPACKSQSSYYRHYRYITAYRRLFLTEYHKEYNKKYYKENKDYFRLYGIAYRGKKKDTHDKKRDMPEVFTDKEEQNGKVLHGI